MTMRMHHVVATAVVVALARSDSVIAHHSFAAEFDAKKTVSLKGVGTAMEERTVSLTVEPPEHWPVYALTDRKEQP